MLVKNGGKTAGLYIGETSRCLNEQSGEHMESAQNGEETSFIIKHWASEHKDHPVMPEFKFSVIQTHLDAFTRLIQESILIETDSTLNSKSEWGRSRRPRLVFEQLDWEIKKAETEKEAETVSRSSSVQEVLQKLSTGKSRNEKKEMKQKKVPEPEIGSASAELVIDNKISNSDCKVEHMVVNVTHNDDCPVKIGYPDNGSLPSTTPGAYHNELEVIVGNTTDMRTRGSPAECNRVLDRNVKGFGVFDSDKTDSVSVNEVMPRCSLFETEITRLRGLEGGG